MPINSSLPALCGFRIMAATAGHSSLGSVAIGSLWKLHVCVTKTLSKLRWMLERDTVFPFQDAIYYSRREINSHFVIYLSSSALRTHFFLIYSTDIYYVPAAAAKSLQSRLTLCDPRDGSPPGSLVPGILQARTLEWVAISFSNAWKWKVKMKSLSCVRLLATSWTAAYQAPLSMGFSRQEYWSGVPLPSPTEEPGGL